MLIPIRPKTSDVSAVPLLDVSRGNQPLKSEIMDAVSSIIDSGQFIGGPFVKELEASVAKVSHAKFAVGCASGSDALLLALMAIGIEPGDEVICPSFTFFATASAIHRLGAIPVFVDIDPTTFNVDPAALPPLITSKTKAIIPVHLFGRCCDMDPILELASQHGLHVIEDCAQSIGSSDKCRRAGSMGTIGCFSFYPTKNVGGFGDGGMLTTNDPEIEDRLRLLANHGMRPRYYHQAVGINSRLDAMQAAVLCTKMKRFTNYCNGRALNAARYQKMLLRYGLKDVLSAPQSDPDCEHVWNQFTVRIPGGRRDQVRQQLADMNVGSEIYYPVPLHEQECFQYLQTPANSLPETDAAAQSVLSLPMFPELTEAEQEHVVSCLAEAMASGTGSVFREA